MVSNLRKFGKNINIALDLNFNLEMTGSKEFVKRLKNKLAWIEIDSYDPRSLNEINFYKFQ